MAKYVVGNTTGVDEAQNVVSNLLAEGFPQDSISVVAGEAYTNGLDAIGVDVVDFDYTDDDRSLWERIKNFFGVDDEDQEWCENMLSSHRQDIENGNILVIVDDMMVSPNLADSLQSKDTGYWTRAYNDGTAAVEDKATVQADRAKAAPRQADSDLRDDETIRLKEERLNVNKENVEAGDVVVTKRVVEQNETINVPLRHEELVVERRHVTDTAPAANASFEEESMTIPLYEEQVRVTKEPVVAEEVRIRKNEVQGNQQVSEKIRKEQLDVTKEGNVVMRDRNTDKNNQNPPAIKG